MIETQKCNFFLQVSLLCVIVSILAIFAGAIEKSVVSSGHTVCYFDGLLLDADAYVPKDHQSGDLCRFCNFNNPLLLNSICGNSTGECTAIANKSLSCREAFPGIGSGVFIGISLIKIMANCSKSCYPRNFSRFLVESSKVVTILRHHAISYSYLLFWRCFEDSWLVMSNFFSRQYLISDTKFKIA